MHKHSLTASINKFTKKTLFTTALLSSLLVIGCGSQKSKPADKGDNDSVIIESAEKSTDTVAARAIIDQVIGTMASAMQMANNMSTQQDGKVRFTDEQVDCFMNHENDLAVDNVQSYLEDSFSKDELEELNAFFGSEAGKKQAELTKKMLKAMMDGEKIDFNNIANLLTEEEQKQIGDFWQSATGSKLQKALNNKEKLMPFIQPFITAKEKKCVPDAK